MSEIRARFSWADEAPPLRKPKEQRFGNSKWDMLAKKLLSNKKNYGRWALVSNNVHFTVVTRLKKDYPEIEWTVRKNENNSWDLWASPKVKVKVKSER